MVETWVVYVVIVVVVVGVGGPVAWLIYRHIQLLRLLRERRDYGTAEDIALESASRRGGLEPHQYTTSVATPHGTLTSPTHMHVGGEERILAITQQDNSHGSDAGQDGRRGATTLITIHQHDEGGNDGNSEEDAQRVSGNASYVLQPHPDSPTELLGVAIENRIRPRHRLPKGTVVVQHADQQVIIDFSQLHDIPTAAPPPLSAEELQKLEEQRNRIASPELYGRAEYLHRSFAASSSFGSAHHASQLQQQSQQQSVGRGAGSRPGSHTATPIRSLRQLTAAELAQLVDGYGYGSPHGSTASLASRSYRPGSLAGNSVRDADRPLRPLFLPQSALVQIPSQPQQQNQKSASPSSHASQKREGARRAGTQSSSHTDTARYSPQAGNGSSSSDLASRSPTHNNNNHSGSSSGIMVDEGRAGRRKTASQRNSQQQQQQRRRQRNGRQSYLYDLESTSDDFDEADAVERMREWEQAAQPSAAAASAKARRRPTSRQDNNSNNTQEEQQMSRATEEAPPGDAQASPTQAVEEEGRRRRDGADEQQQEQQTGSNSHKDSNGAAVGQCSEAASHSPMQRPEQATTTKTTNATTANASHVGQQ